MDGLTFGERLHVLRKRRNMTMRKLGEMADCAPSDIYRFEHGDVKNPTAHKLAALARALGVSMDRLWQGEEPLQDTNIDEMEPAVLESAGT